VIGGEESDEAPAGGSARRRKPAKRIARDEVQP